MHVYRTSSTTPGCPSTERARTSFGAPETTSTARTSTPTPGAVFAHFPHQEHPDYIQAQLPTSARLLSTGHTRRCHGHDPVLHGHGRHYVGQQVCVRHALDLFSHLKGLQAPASRQWTPDALDAIAAEAVDAHPVSSGHPFGRSIQEDRHLHRPRRISLHRIHRALHLRTAPSFGPRRRSTSPHNKQDYQPVESTVTKDATSDRAGCEAQGTSTSRPGQGADAEALREATTSTSGARGGWTDGSSKGKATACQHDATTKGMPTPAPKAAAPPFIEVHDPWNDDMVRAASPVPVHHLTPQLGQNARLVTTTLHWLSTSTVTHRPPTTVPQPHAYNNSPPLPRPRGVKLGRRYATHPGRARLLRMVDQFTADIFQADPEQPAKILTA